MNVHGNRASALALQVIDASGGILGPEDRESLRAVLRISFEVQDFLLAKEADAEALDWMQGTILSGVDSIGLLRMPLRGNESSASAPIWIKSFDELRTRFFDALRAIDDPSLSIESRIDALQVVCRLQLVLLGATLW